MVPVRQIRAVYTEDTVTVYQAYNPTLGVYAAAHGRFPDTYNRDRMTWIKPSFLWMMYRSGWATKQRQERVLAIEITRSGLEWALVNAALSHYQPDVHASRGDWAATLRKPVRVQWDPERSLTMRPLEYRSLQVGLSGEAVNRYADSWIVGITDVTGLAHRIHGLVQAGDLTKAEALLPPERPYPLPAGIARTLRAETTD
ncbi:DUF4291 domain-containing protein [Actinocrispum sp. NPDC049592]|uniref:DUF4291 domain-containing protein n=1 Tax=Actinocrispum sp. NPDC049592 TaxID=3154835 RepID=UPI003432D73D